MALESATYISGLVDTNPAGSDAISQGDDHIRLIKTVLKNTLPNADEAMNGIHASASEPSPNSTGQLWFDTTNNLIKIRNEADDAWITLLATEGSRLLKVTHNIPASSSYLRSATYADSVQTITHTALSTSSTLYITYNGFIQYAFNFDAGTATCHIRLANTSGTLIGGTTDDIRCLLVDDVDHSANPTWDNTVGVSRTWKVTSGNRPTADSGTTYTFDIWTKCDPVADGGTTFNYGTMTCLEIEE